MHWAICAECNVEGYGFCMAEDYEYYCPQCYEYDELRRTRCFSFAAIYGPHNEIPLSIGASQNGCAERNAMWKLKDTDIDTEKVIVVCRVRRKGKNNKLSFGVSKPCQQCIQSMHMYNVTRICYSNGTKGKGSDNNMANSTAEGLNSTDFSWTDLASLSNKYKSRGRVIVRL